MNASEELELLSGRSRRFVLKQLAENDGVFTLDALAERLADGCTDTTIERARIALYHYHLPKLADRGAIEFDERSGDVVLTDGGKALLPTIRSLDEMAEDAFEPARCN